MSPRALVLSLLFFTACGDDAATTVDLGPPDLRRVIDLSGPRSGVGEACTQSRGPRGSCKNGDDALCIPEGQLGFPGGYCTQACDKIACPSDADCVELAPGFSLCMASCNTDADCRSGYSCSDYNACVPIGGVYLGGEVRPGSNNGEACVTPAVDPPHGSAFEANQQLSTITGGETHLAVDELRGNVVVAWIQLYPPQAIGVMASHDSGQTWDPPQFLPADNSVVHGDTQSDPVVAVDSQGNFFITWIGFDGYGEHLEAYVASSTDGGASFPTVSRASPRDEWANSFFLDKPWMAVGPDDSVYVTWSAAATPNGGAVIRATRSVDQGLTWSAPVTVTPDENTFHNLAEVAVAADGSVYVIDVELDGNNFGDTANRIVLQRLTADLALDGAPVVVSAAADSPPFDEPSLAVDGNNVYVAYASGTPLGAWDMRVAASSNRGVSFAAPVTVNDDATCATHMHPAISVDGVGRAHVVFYDNRYGSAALMHTASSAPASVGPLSFTANEFVNDMSFTFTTERDTGDWLGDYPGITSHGAHSYVVWTDNRVNDTSQIFFSRTGF